MCIRDRVYGIPEFRLPKAIVQKEIDKLSAMGVEVMTNMVIGKVLSIDEIIDDMGYDAVFIGTGAGLPDVYKRQIVCLSIPFFKKLSFFENFYCSRLIYRISLLLTSPSFSLAICSM